MNVTDYYDLLNENSMLENRNKELEETLFALKDLLEGMVVELNDYLAKLDKQNI